MLRNSLRFGFYEERRKRMFWIYFLRKTWLTEQKYLEYNLF